MTGSVRLRLPARPVQAKQSMPLVGLREGLGGRVEAALGPHSPSALTGCRHCPAPLGALPERLRRSREDGN